MERDGVGTLGIIAVLVYAIAAGVLMGRYIEKREREYRQLQARVRALEPAPSVPELPPMPVRIVVMEEVNTEEVTHGS